MEGERKNKAQLPAAPTVELYVICWAALKQARSESAHPRRRPETYSNTDNPRTDVHSDQWDAWNGERHQWGGRT